MQVNEKIYTGFLYEVTDKEDQKRGYLFGTLDRIATEDADYRLNEKVLEAFNASEVFICEYLTWDNDSIGRLSYTILQEARSGGITDEMIVRDARIWDLANGQFRATMNEKLINLSKVYNKNITEIASYEDVANELINQIDLTPIIDEEQFVKLKIDEQNQVLKNYINGDSSYFKKEMEGTNEFKKVFQRNNFKFATILDNKLRLDKRVVFFSCQVDRLYTPDVNLKTFLRNQGWTVKKVKINN